jgi:hypothetical protein
MRRIGRLWKESNEDTEAREVRSVTKREKAKIAREEKRRGSIPKKIRRPRI